MPAFSTPSTWGRTIVIIKVITPVLSAAAVQHFTVTRGTMFILRLFVTTQIAHGWCRHSILPKHPVIFVIPFMSPRRLFPFTFVVSHRNDSRAFALCIVVFAFQSGRIQLSGLLPL